MNGEEREVIPVRFRRPRRPALHRRAELKDWGIAPEKLSLQSFSGARWLCVEGIGLKLPAGSGTAHARARLSAGAVWRLRVRRS